ncbi:Hypothetical protein FKW44_003458 [Caligus rogercresseyi]|uniref:Uncharacterized protein n=1 Tax=Caligus rogercresseyi TaxID=217165 RepID=A0A7T8KLM9_CALRO|nr:Hypothetical protein FKW44_003458 [Caligus rogercresseyi]
MSTKDIVPEDAPSSPETESISNEENGPLTSTTALGSSWRGRKMRKLNHWTKQKTS